MLRDEIDELCDDLAAHLTDLRKRLDAAPGERLMARVVVGLEGVETKLGRIVRALPKPDGASGKPKK